MIKIYDTKLLLIGEPGSGKTTLVKRLVNEITESNYPKPNASEITHGIEITSLAYSEGKNDYKLNIWDFGGHENYHSMHQFFLSKRSLYVLVLDNSRREFLEGYWLEIQRILAENSPLLVIININREIDGFSESNTHFIPINKIKSKFKNIHFHLEIDLVNDNSEISKVVNWIKEESRRLVLTTTSIINKEAYFNFRNNLEFNLTEDYISLNDFKDLLEDSKIIDHQEQDSIIDHLHDLGVILHFKYSNELKVYIFLNIPFIINGIYLPINHAISLKEGSVFSERELEIQWRDKGYKELEYCLRAFMRKFELYFSYTDSTEFLFFPCFAKLAPSGRNWSPENNLRLIVKYNFMPKGLIPRLIVRMESLILKGEKKITENIWRKGVILEYNYNRALIEWISDNTIEIKIKGISPGELLSLIEFNLDIINKSFRSEKILIEKFIPCCCNICIDSETPNYFNKKSLPKAKRRGNKILCEESMKWVRVDDLLAGTSQELAIIDKRVTEELKQLIINNDFKSLFQKLEIYTTPNDRYLVLLKSKWKKMIEDSLTGLDSKSRIDEKRDELRVGVLEYVDLLTDSYS